MKTFFGDIIEKKQLSESVFSLRLSIPTDVTFVAGQYFDIKLTSVEGYYTKRSYSALSAPEELPLLEFGIQHIEDGEVSSFLRSIDIGSSLELQGPIGRHFMLSDTDSPLVLIGGGSGIVPLISMVRSLITTGSSRKVYLFYSARVFSDVIFHEYLVDRSITSDTLEYQTFITGEVGIRDDVIYERIDSRAILEVVKEDLLFSEYMICGRSGFVDYIGGLLTNIGVAHDKVKSERFG